MGWTSSIRQALGGGAPGAPTSSSDVPASMPPPLSLTTSDDAPVPPPSSSKKSKQSPGSFEAFDPTALERGVAAIRELNTSPHAERALELARAQEMTKQLETQAAIESARARNNEYAKSAQMELDELRKKNEMERLQEEKQTALYKAKVQSRLEEQQLQQRRAYDEEQMRKQREEFLEQERIKAENAAAIEAQRLAAYAKQAKIDQETARVRAEAEADGRIKQERLNEDVATRRLHAEKEASLQERLAVLAAHYGNVRSMGSSIYEVASDPVKCAQGVAAVTALALGVYGARAGTGVIGKYVSARLGRPNLVRETSRRNWLKPRNWFAGTATSPAAVQSAVPGGKAVDQVVLPPALRSRLTWIADTAAAAVKHNSPHRHVLLHGPPGTGKTLFARALAADSGMDYAIVSGGDLSQLGQAAVTELHALFDWAEQSPRGAVLFFDEADSFLRAGRDNANVISEQGRHILSAFLQRTGSDSHKFMIVLASNMEVRSFDEAVRDRVDEFVEFTLPDDEERRRMLKLFADRYLMVEDGSVGPIRRWWHGAERRPVHAFSDADYAELSELLNGSSGRQIAKFVISMRAAVLGNLTPKATVDVAGQLLQWQQWDRKVPTVESIVARSKKDDAKDDRPTQTIVDAPSSPPPS